METKQLKNGDYVRFYTPYALEIGRAANIDCYSVDVVWTDEYGETIVYVRPIYTVTKMTDEEVMLWRLSQ